MSYSIYIGEATVAEYDAEDPDDAAEVYVTVERIESRDAPSFPGDEMTGKTNGRHPGYSQWGEFCEQTGLFAIFFDTDDGLLVPHPGVRRLTKKHLAAFAAAEKKWLAKHPDKIAGWDPAYNLFAMGTTKAAADPRYDGNAERLRWLVWWTEWALKNCKKPSMANS